MCLLSRSLYGLKQAPRAWYHWIAGFLVELGFVSTQSDASLFVYQQGGDAAHLLLYVDDIVLAASSDTLLRRLISRLQDKFALKDLGALHYFLGVEVTRCLDGFFLCQHKYALELLERAGMTNCKPASTPVDTKGKVSSMDGALAADGSFYRSNVGALQYLTLTRPDLTYAVQQVFLHMHAPRDVHWALVKRVLRYIRGTPALGLTLPASSSLDLVAMTAVTGTSEILVTQCYPPPTPTVNGSTSAFRRDLLSLLDALPSAAAPTGFASMRTGGAFARGLCFGDPAPDSCFRCLSDVGRKITDLCGDVNRRAGFLIDGCFPGYADTNASSAGADDNDISGVTFSGDALRRFDNVDVQKLVAVAQSLVPRAANCQVASANATTTASNGDTVRVLAQCAPDRDAAECARCLRDSSLQMAKSWSLTLTAGVDVQGSVAAVLGPDCYLRLEISAPPLREKIREYYSGR